MAKVTKEDKKVATRENAGPLAGFMFMSGGGLEALRENLGGDTISPMDLDRIKIPSGNTPAWSIPDISGKSKVVQEIQGVIIGYRPTRVYWDKPFESGEKMPPLCASADGIVGVGTPGGMCSTCGFSQWGSDPKGTGGQACKQVNLLFVMLPGSILPYVFPLPPTSIPPMKKYLVQLVGQEIPSYTAITNFALAPAKNKGGIEYSVIKPTLVEEITDPDAREAIKAFKKSLEGVFSKVTANQEDVTA